MPKLRIAHYPQIPCTPFYVEVAGLNDARRMMQTLAEYDLFQLTHRIKPDFCNMQTLEMYDGVAGEWVAWVDEETGIDDLDEYFDFLQSVKDDETNVPDAKPCTVGFALRGELSIVAPDDESAKRIANQLIDDVIEDAERLLATPLYADDYTTDVSFS